MVAVLLVLLALNISNVYSGGFTYNDIESLFPKIVEKNTADDPVTKAITDRKIKYKPMFKLMCSISKLKEPACEQKYRLLENEQVKVLQKDCFPHILNHDIMQKMYDNKDECINQIIKPHVEKIKSEKKCKDLHKYTEKKDDLFNVLQYFCQKKVNNKLPIVSNQRQRTKIMRKLVSTIRSEFKIQLLPKDTKDKISNLKAMIKKTAEKTWSYNEFANAISQWFLKALKWMKNIQKFEIRKITHPPKFNQVGETKFKEELLSFYKQFPDEKVDEEIIKAVVTDIMERLQNFAVYDSLKMWILPTNGYNFDSLKHKSGHDAINKKLAEQKMWFMEQDQDTQKQQRWENELIHSLCPDPVTVDCKTEIKQYCVEAKPGDVIAKWSTCSDVIAIKHYTDTDKTCYNFRKTFYCDPKADRLCRPHIYVAWKMQMERVFKKITQDYKKHLHPAKSEKKRLYYHGIGNRCYDWKSLKTMRFTGPMSWTTNRETAEVFATSEGASSVRLVGRISDASRYRPLSVTRISNKPYEGELLFFDASVDLVNVQWLRTDRFDEKACDAKVKHQQPKFNPQFNL